MDLRHIEEELHDRVNNCYPDDNILQNSEKYVDCVVKYIKLYCDDNDINDMGVFKCLDDNKESFKEKYSNLLSKSEIGLSLDQVPQEKARKILSHIFKELLVGYMNISSSRYANISYYSEQIVAELTEKTIMSYYRYLCL